VWVCPGNNESAGKRRSGAIAPGEPARAEGLSASRLGGVAHQGSYLQALYHHIAARRGKKRALVAVAHSIVISGWHMLTTTNRT